MAEENSIKLFGFEIKRAGKTNDKLKSVGVNPIYTKFRHKRFWDSGLHCLTLDTYREGSCREIN